MKKTTPSDIIFLRIAVATPLRRCFDYLPPKSCDPAFLVPGIRVQVAFGRQIKIGVLVEIANSSEVAPAKLKAALAILDYQPILPEDVLSLLTWASRYYQYPLGEVVSAALPGLLRKGKVAELKGLQTWRLSQKGAAIDIEALKGAPRQVGLLKTLAQHRNGVSAEQLSKQHINWRPIMKNMVSKGWVIVEERPGYGRNKVHTEQAGNKALALNINQAQAVNEITSSLSLFTAFLLDGVTGSGKTEVYLQAIEAVIARGWQVLVLVPEIGLTPQLVSRFERRLPQSLAVLHSGLNEQERLNAWLLAQTGQASVVIGTRSAVFTPLPRLGLIIIDEEHDTSFKQQDGFRYSARDIAVRRAHNLDIPIVLGSATPSLESLNNAKQKRYKHLVLPERAGEAQPPQITIVDLRSKALFEGLSPELLTAISTHLAKQGQVLLFLNRRGYAPTLLCHDCGWIAQCNRCDSHMTIYRNHHRLRCHHCAAERPIDVICPQCQSEALVTLGEGTERIEQALQQRFPEVETVRIDRDTTRRKGAMQSIISNVREGLPMILIGTQMLAKGHHFPNVTLVGVLGVDHGLFSVDFRAGERLAQLIIQVVGRAGRAEKIGQVLIQSHHPNNPLLVKLVQEGYQSFAEDALATRQAAHLPPFSYMALLRAEAVDIHSPFTFLERAKQIAPVSSQVALYGPVAAPMERRAGKYRAQLLIQADSRKHLQQLLTPWILQLDNDKAARKVRWSIDVDPVELY